MKSRSVNRGIALAAVMGLSAFFGTVVADEPEQVSAEPGYRPHSEFAFEFVQAWDSASIAVLPTIVRRESRTAHSFDSQQQIIALLETHGAAPVGKNYRLDLGPLLHQSQWNTFEQGLATTAQSLLERNIDADYALVMELLSPMEGMFFGIEVYIIDQEGRNAFSFLLNAHHQLFADANLLNAVSSEEAREAMTERATAAAITALLQQIDQARDCAARMAAFDIEVMEAGILHDFESELVTASDEHGIPLGLSTFADENSSAAISTTSSHPARPGQVEGNQVLQLDMNVTAWAGVVSIFTNDAVDTWTPMDWSSLDEMTFWLYGNNTGAELFVDVLDNRNPCSTGDDAERYTLTFVDDFAGWQQITIRFADMDRKEIYNGAPSDGLGLSTVHGWGFGAANVGGEVTYYIDDVVLRSSQAE